jgi:site-specific recombinase XerD
MTTELSLIVQRTLGAVIQPVLDAVDSPHTRRAYRRALQDFLAWFDAQGRPKLSKAVVQRYAVELRESGIGASSINQRLSAIRKLVAEAADNGALTEAQAVSIKAVHGMRQEGQRSGNWLTRAQAQELITAPDETTLKGKRDRAILAILIGCGLRRTETARLTLAHVQQRDGRWVIVDLAGKRNKIRTVPMPSWAKAAIDDWVQAALAAGAPMDSNCYLFRSITRAVSIGASLTDQAIYDLVVAYAAPLGFTVAAHDLRRTYAKLAHKGGAALEQIQISLGHASVKTTEKYLGVEQDLTDAPCDHLGLRLH